MVHVDESQCIGCGICQNVCPDGFEIINGKAKLKNDNALCIKDAVNACPRGAIVLNGNVPVDDQGRGMGRGLGRGMEKY